jgi:hypothetical protein
MHPVWAQRRKEVLSDCLVSPDVFTQMVERLGESTSKGAAGPVTFRCPRSPIAYMLATS